MTAALEQTMIDKHQDDQPPSPASAALDGTPREPDGIDDGVEWWEVRDGFDVERDATSVVHGPTYRVGGRAVSESTLRGLRDAITSALAADTTPAGEG